MQDQQVTMSEFQKVRRQYQPMLPRQLQSDLLDISEVPMEPSHVTKEIAELFPMLSKDPLKFKYFQPLQALGRKESLTQTPLRIGLVLSGGQAAGGHNVIAGIFDGCKQHHPMSQIFGFLDGPIGIINNKYVQIEADFMDKYRNQGGFDMICSGRDKIETEEQKAKALKNCKILGLHGLVIIGGDDSNTNAAVLADYFLQQKSDVCVIGVPKTIDGDLRNEHIEMSFGFDSACKTYSELIGNVAQDCLSDKIYYHFIRLMGRSASHITLECQLQCRANLALIGEEIQQKNITLPQCVDQIADLICKRAEFGKNYGLILVPEGLIEFFPDVQILIKELSTIMAKNLQANQEEIVKSLTETSRKIYDFLPSSIQAQLFIDRDSHGNVQVAKIETEQLLVLLVAVELAKRKETGKYAGKFVTQCHYFGYEGRCCLPSNFDTNYCYALGVVAGGLIAKKQTGYITTLKNLKNPPEDWVPGGTPLISMMTIEVRKGKNVPVIKKALVELDSHIFKTYETFRDKWAINDCYRSPGPIQFEGSFANESNFHLKQLPIASFISPGDDNKSQVWAARNYADLSELERERIKYKPEIPQILESNQFKVSFPYYLDVEDIELKQQIEKAYPCYSKCTNQHRYSEFIHQNQMTGKVDTIAPQALEKGLVIGVVYQGNQAPGALNIIDGLLRYADHNPGTKILGFLGGASGLLQQKYIEIKESMFKNYRNLGGFTLLGRKSDSLRKPDELQMGLKACLDCKLDGLVMIGATHTLTDCTIFGEYLLAQGVKTRVIAVPATVDNNIRHMMLESSLGFDTASKLYSQLIGNNMTDAASAKKYWYFMRLMGRDPSHQVLETSLQTHPNIVIISEEHEAKGDQLSDIVEAIAEQIIERASQGKNFGTVLIPEGLLAHLPYMKQLIKDTTKMFQSCKTKEEQEKLAQDLLSKPETIKQKLSSWVSEFFLSLPIFTREQILLEREQTTGGIQFSRIETERLLSYLVKQELKKRKEIGEYKMNFSTVEHFFGYQGRGAIPTNFDCSLGSTYGYVAATLIACHCTIYLASVRGLLNPPSQWIPAGIPIRSMIRVKEKYGYQSNTPVVPSNEVDLRSKPYEIMKSQQKSWLHADHFINPGPVQFQGYEEINKTTTFLQKDYLNLLAQVTTLSKEIHSICEFGVSDEVLKIAINNLNALKETLNIVKKNIKQ